jgi:hypothetical protein
MFFWLLRNIGCWQTGLPCENDERQFWNFTKHHVGIEGDKSAYIQKVIPSINILMSINEKSMRIRITLLS